ncbi:hypothetical protein ACQEVF_52745 [Nonomuraea polychroma]|uniref:hypothetical protein n=1 Tax=Nonomuraea polychroma TaxID=46176 RepID=UPI003D8C1210
MKNPRRRLIPGIRLAPLLSGCFASPDGLSSANSSGSGEGGRLRVALAFTPTQNFSPCGQDDYLLSRRTPLDGPR